MDSSVLRERRNLVSARVPSHFNWPFPAGISVFLPQEIVRGCDMQATLYSLFPSLPIPPTGIWQCRIQYLTRHNVPTNLQFTFILFTWPIVHHYILDGAINCHCLSMEMEKQQTCCSNSERHSCNRDALGCVSHFVCCFFLLSEPRFTAAGTFLRGLFV